MEFIPNMYCELRIHGKLMWADGEDMLCLDDLLDMLGLDTEDSMSVITELAKSGPDKEPDKEPDMKPIFLPESLCRRKHKTMWVTWPQVKAVARILSTLSLSSQQSNVPDILLSDGRAFEVDPLTSKRKEKDPRNKARAWRPVRSLST